MTQCRYVSAGKTHIYIMANNTSMKPAVNVPQNKVHVCAFCGGAGEYKCSEVGKRVRR